MEYGEGNWEISSRELEKEGTGESINTWVESSIGQVRA